MLGNWVLVSSSVRLISLLGVSCLGNRGMGVTMWMSRMAHAEVLGERDVGWSAQPRNPNLPPPARPQSVSDVPTSTRLATAPASAGDRRGVTP